MADKKLLFILFTWSLLWMMTGRNPSAHSSRLKLQSAHATFYGGPDASVAIAMSPKPAPTSAPIINDDKKEDMKVENNSKFVIICGYPCCGIRFRRCARCCPPYDMNDVKKAANGGGGAGHVGGDGHN